MSRALVRACRPPARASAARLASRTGTDRADHAGSNSVSGKAFDSLCYFINGQNTEGRTNEVAVIHAYDKMMDLEKPIHLQSPRILQQYETNLIRARRNYDLKGPGRLKSQTFPLEYKTSEELVKVASLEYAESVGTSEHAPAVVAVILDCIAKSFQADYVFMGSFGVGGKRVGEMGSVTDYMLRLCNHTMVVVKHWRPVPKQGEGATFLVCLDGSPAANEGLEKVIFLARDGDKLVCVTVSRHKVKTSGGYGRGVEV
ncbi:hypothetical protein GUITHDRAFT_137245 [Guillardia theta CCMP2712]|uniref:UspA domain-containing protein n=1 Tax=Guillardia theta (strain CCMP2712) TaxID=905079 RepID=L1JHB0_GUITC|nr:hypothetical protein GUITHDRAFT_137245 [Guillardia theta CCMP2712]EKX47876.1 hypothetical protein GUITHDRAFT_137245 [Guillardia theta CCMP2712]|eukprot:XP_005834856.1 hypothetical protein GUITHDRAFT_137245 [Guillardia theta CCMP2712]